MKNKPSKSITKATRPVKNEQESFENIPKEKVSTKRRPLKPKLIEVNFEKEITLVVIFKNALTKEIEAQGSLAK